MAAERGDLEMLRFLSDAAPLKKEEPLFSGLLIDLHGSMVPPAQMHRRR